MTVTRMLSAAVTAMLIALFSFSASASATSPNAGRDTIAFTKQGLWLENIWQVRADGTKIQPMTYLGGKDPVWSPDGRQLAFVNPLSNRLQIVQQNGQVSTVTKAPGHIRQFSPAWSKDGSHIAFIEERTDGSSTEQAVGAANLASGVVKNVTDWSSAAHYRSPSWSPDGHHIVYEQNDGSAATLQISDVQTKVSSMLTRLSDVTKSRQVSWSPSGKKILYNDSENEIYTIWPDGSHRSTISDGDSYDAAWSPDGTTIAFLESHTGEGMSMSGTDGTVTQIPINQGKYASIAKPIWSPDGKQLLFSMTNTTAPRPITDIFTLTLQSGEQKLVTHAVIGGYDW